MNIIRSPCRELWFCAALGGSDRYNFVYSYFKVQIIPTEFLRTRFEREDAMDCIATYMNVCRATLCRLIKAWRDSPFMFLLTAGLFTCFLFTRPIAIAAPHPGPPASGDGSARAEKSPSPADISHAIALAGAYLERACGPDGKFTYQVNTISGRPSRSYNVVRHAGAIYALAMLDQAHPDQQAADAMLRAAIYLHRNYVGQGVRPGMLEVWAQPSGKGSNADLGATGLGLVALAAVKKTDPDSIPIEQLQALGRFLLFLQNADGSFINRYNADTGPVADSDILYYPGEAALGLLSLYELDHSQIWLNAASKALAYLANSTKKLTVVPADHWALIATAKLLPYCEHVGCPVSREDLLHHASQICVSILRDQISNPAIPSVDGAFDTEGRTTPTATRMEGLLAALEFLPLGQQRTEVKTSVDRGIAFLLRSQVVSGWYAGGLPGESPLLAPGASEIRIDYVQHALCAWLRYQRLLDGSR